jgi:hypothetical protein
MMQRRSFLYVSLASLLALLSGLLLFLASRSEHMAPITTLLIVVSGMMIFSALSAFQRFLESREDTPVIHISFNETILKNVLAEEPVKPAVQEPPWEISSAQLVGVDNVLAAAKLRMELESELRRIAFAYGITFEKRLFSFNQLIDQLVEREVLTLPVQAALRDIISICSRAVHGESLTNEDAVRVVRVGNQLLDVLRSIEPSTSEQNQWERAT